MAEIGITEDGTSGKLKIDDDKLTKVLKDNTAQRGHWWAMVKKQGITAKIAEIEEKLFGG